MVGERAEVAAAIPVVDSAVGTKPVAGPTVLAIEGICASSLGDATLAATAATPEASLATGKIIFYW